MNYDKALEFIKKAYGQAIKPGLTRVVELLEGVGNPQDKLKFVHVAGTNGKGSVCVMTASILSAAGYRTGLFTSPVLFEYRQQFMVDGTPISAEEFCQLADQIKSVSDAMEDKPSEFEKCVALAFLYFAKMDCDLVVLEVGMGGAGDATNVIAPPLVAAITNIDFDHMGFLGNSLMEIATQKAGIIKPGSRVAVARQNTEVSELISGISMAYGCDCVVPDEAVLIKAGDTLDFSYKGRAYSLALRGCHQLQNVALVLEIIAHLKDLGYNITDASVDSGLSTVKWPGRFELIDTKPDFILDGAHNPDGIKALVKNLEIYYPDEKFVFITGILKDKDYTDMISQMLGKAYAFITVAPDSPRALSPDECADAIKKAGFDGEVDVFAQYDEAVARAYEVARKSHPICAFGSLYSVPGITKAWENYKKTEK